MASQFSLLNRKVFVSNADISWISEPMYWGGFQRCEAFLTIYGHSQEISSVTLGFQGSNEPGFNATWRTIAAGTPADPSTTPDLGPDRYVRDATLYPWVRLVVSAVGSGTITRAIEVSLDGTLHDVAVG